jgi:predicted Zn finger-like uncharacterized protein
MPVTVPCPSCGTNLRIPDTAVGKRVKCSKCETAFTAEPPAEAPPAEAVQAEVPARKAARPADEEPEERGDDEEEYEEDEDERRYGRRRRGGGGGGDGGISTLIPYKNGRALAAYYCGVFAIVPCFGPVLGPIALIFGILGLRFVKAHPTAGGTGHAIAGIVLGIITTLLWGGLALVGVVGMIVAAASGPHH